MPIARSRRNAWVIIQWLAPFFTARLDEAFAA